MLDTWWWPLLMYTFALLGLPGWRSKAKQSKAKQSNANHAYCFALPCLARGVSHSKAKQCKAKRKTAVGYIALLCFEQSNARQGKAVFFFALHCFALLWAIRCDWWLVGNRYRTKWQLVWLIFAVTDDAYCFALSCLALLCFAQSKAKQCKAKRKTANSPSRHIDTKQHNNLEIAW